MKSWILYLFLIGQALLSSYDLEKYGKLEARTDPYIIFDSSDFKIGDHIYFKISGINYNYGNIEYEFFDNYIEYSDYSTHPTSKAKTLSYSSKSTYNNHKYTDEVRYYTIEKTRNLIIGDGEGQYLAIYPNCYLYDIENYKQNIALIIGVVVGVAVVAVIIGIILYCYRKKKIAAANNQVYSQNPNTINQVQVQNNNNNVNKYNQNYNLNFNNGVNSNENFNNNNVPNSNYPNNYTRNSNYPNNNVPNSNYPNNNAPNYNYQNNNAPNYNYQNNNVPNYY